MPWAQKRPPAEAGGPLYIRLVEWLEGVHEDHTAGHAFNRDVAAPSVGHALDVVPRVGQELLMHFLWVRQINGHNYIFSSWWVDCPRIEAVQWTGTSTREP